MLQMRRAVPENRADIIQLWQAGFGDDEAFIDEFCAWCGYEQILLLWEDGEPRALTAVPLMEVAMPDGETAKVGYIYAHTTLKEHRGKGFGKMLLNYADFCLQNQNADGAVLVPAEESLFNYFARSGYQKAFYLKEEAMRPAEDGEVQPILKPVDEVEYHSIREELLKENPHVVNPLPMLKQYQQPGEEKSLGLYSVEVNGQTGCATVECGCGKELFLHELLVPQETLDRAAGLLLKAMEAECGKLRRPLFPGEAGGKAFGAVKWYRPEAAQRWGNRQEAYFGLVMD